MVLTYFLVKLQPDSLKVSVQIGGQVPVAEDSGGDERVEPRPGPAVERGAGAAGEGAGRDVQGAAGRRVEELQEGGD